MKREIINFETPNYLFCEKLPKDGTFQDQRVWIYSTKSLSLIEFVCMTDISVNGISEERKAGEFSHNGEDFYAYWTQNNCEATDNNKEEIIEGAWLYYLNYMQWRDKMNENSLN